MFVVSSATDWKKYSVNNTNPKTPLDAVAALLGFLFIFNIMELKGKITLLVGNDVTRIELKDVNSGITFAYIKLTPEQLSQCLSRQAYVDCEMQLLQLENVGKQHIMEKHEFVVPEFYKERGDREALADYSQTLLDDGWISDRYFGSQTSFFDKDGVKYARTTKRKYI